MLVVLLLVFECGDADPFWSVSRVTASVGSSKGRQAEESYGMVWYGTTRQSHIRTKTGDHTFGWSAFLSPVSLLSYITLQ